jgi:hypothetical protein
MQNLILGNGENVVQVNSPQQINLWNFVYNILQGKKTIEHVFYTGVTGAGDLTVYSAKKLFICYELQVGGDFTLRTAGAAMRLYNEANAIVFSGTNQMIYWDTTAAAIKVLNQNFGLQNIYFSRIDVNAAYYAYMSFNGYKITIP